jgi:hypothetical protein
MGESVSKRQAFTVLQVYKDFEVRSYPSYLIAEMGVPERFSITSNDGFSTLLNYISKGNKHFEAIAMTAPVISYEDSNKSSSKYISFVMPEGSKLSNLPLPNDPKITLREINSEICVAKSFTGSVSKELVKLKIEELRSSALIEGIILSDLHMLCRFDPPYKPGFMKYNEIVIPVIKSS